MGRGDTSEKTEGMCIRTDFVPQMGFAAPFAHVSSIKGLLEISDGGCVLDVFQRQIYNCIKKFLLKL